MTIKLVLGSCRRWFRNCKLHHLAASTKFQPTPVRKTSLLLFQQLIEANLSVLQAVSMFLLADCSGCKQNPFLMPGKLDSLFPIHQILCLYVGGRSFFIMHYTVICLQTFKNLSNHLKSLLKLVKIG